VSGQKRGIKNVQITLIVNTQLIGYVIQEAPGSFFRYQLFEISSVSLPIFTAYTGNQIIVRYMFRPFSTPLV